ncbi:uncharacterized protein LOC117571469 [Drosophila albomicans]|uniref:Uncharacterized protein LOC117571469 n=1 Tax=Drosophila albomicans TaxID=7291 RepID=A0A6P8XBM8_DROAB|nr:uncharacterized protein LOC117571469 [Drosophila albomicans]
MKFELLLLTLLAHRILPQEVNPINCRVSLKPMLICAFSGGCFMNIDQKDIELLNCERKQKGFQNIEFVAEGECPESFIPACKTFDYK